MELRLAQLSRYRAFIYNTFRNGFHCFPYFLVSGNTYPS